jgi:hypothetical protein
MRTGGSIILKSCGKNLRLMVIKTVKYPPVQSKHQQAPTAVLHMPPPPTTPLRVFFYQFCDVAKMVIVYIKKRRFSHKYGYQLDMEIKIL